MSESNISSTGSTAGEVITEITTLSSITSTTTTEFIAEVVNSMNVSEEHTYRNGTFVQTPAGEGIAGICVWAAILITCHQIYQVCIIIQLPSIDFFSRIRSC